MSEKVRNREKGYTEDEARKLLAHCLSYLPANSNKFGIRESRYVSAAKRWVPWLCAFTGARVAEIGQLRKADIRIAGDINYIRITPEAGSVKSGQYRDVPLHPQLVDLGFLDFVRTAPDGPLFFDSNGKRTSKELPAAQLSKTLSRWLRSTGFAVAEVSPNHGWRHRFKTQARELRLDPRVVDAIQGHAARTAGENYGDVTLSAKRHAIDALPPTKF